MALILNHEFIVFTTIPILDKHVEIRFSWSNCFFLSIIFLSIYFYSPSTKLNIGMESDPSLRTLGAGGICQHKESFCVGGLSLLPSWDGAGYIYTISDSVII